MSEETVIDEIRALRKDVVDLSERTSVQHTELKGDMARVEQKVDLYHAEHNKLEQRVNEAEGDIDSVQQTQAATNVKVTLLGAAAGGIIAFLKEALGIGQG